MKDSNSWLNDQARKTSKFINQRYNVGEEFIGIYKARRRAKNKFGKTFHYIFPSSDGNGELIFDSKNPRIAELFEYIPFESRVSIKKIFKDGRIQYDVRFLNTIEDEKPGL